MYETRRHVCASWFDILNDTTWKERKTYFQNLILAFATATASAARWNLKCFRLTIREAITSRTWARYYCMLKALQQRFDFPLKRTVASLRRKLHVIETGCMHSSFWEISNNIKDVFACFTRSLWDAILRSLRSLKVLSPLWALFTRLKLSVST